MMLTLIPFFDRNMSVSAYSLFTRKNNFLMNPSLLGSRQFDGAAYVDGLELIQELGTTTLSGGKPIFVSLNNISIFSSLESESVLLGVNMITTFIGRDSKKNVDENMELVKEVWTPIVRYAEEKGVRIAIENCPMLFTNDEWPGGQNIMSTPANWRRVFEILDSPNLGINYDPSHFVWQQIDYIKPIYEFKDKIFHVHYKDIKVFWDKLADVGVMATPLEYMSPKIPGLGDVDWGKYVSALTDIGFEGCSVIEIEDKSFEKDIEDAKRAIRLSARYLRNFIE